MLKTLTITEAVLKKCKEIPPFFFSFFRFFFATKKDGKSVGFLWSQGGDQFELEEVQIGVNGVIESHSKYTFYIYLQFETPFFYILKEKEK